MNTLNDTYNVTGSFLLYFQNCSRYYYEMFRKVRKMYRTSLSRKILKINHCFFVSKVLRQNNLHFQKLQNWADNILLEINLSFIETRHLPFHSVALIYDF